MGNRCCDAPGDRAIIPDDKLGRVGKNRKSKYKRRGQQEIDLSMH